MDGYSLNKAKWIGAITSWLFYLQIELFDGIFEQWGFSLGDFAANAAGAFMPVIAGKCAMAHQLKLKLSYQNSAEISAKLYMLENYSGMTFWLSAHLPLAVDHFWRSFLNSAAGY